jgi:hypothetical protein
VYSFLGDAALQSGEHVPTFLKKLLQPSSGHKMKMNATGSSETSVSASHPEYRNLTGHHCDNAKTRIFRIRSLISGSLLGWKN